METKDTKGHPEGAELGTNSFPAEDPPELSPSFLSIQRIGCTDTQAILILPPLHLWKAAIPPRHSGCDMPCAVSRVELIFLCVLHLKYLHVCKIFWTTSRLLAGEGLQMLSSPQSLYRLRTCHSTPGAFIILASLPPNQPADPI